MKIIACHLLNDYSGSPKVLSQLIKIWVNHNIDVTIVTCVNRIGFLSDIKNANYNYFWYKWSSNNVLRLVNFTLSQIILFFKILCLAKSIDIIYVNTILPFGAALAAKLKGCRVIYHVHETTMKPAVLKWFLFKIVKITASDVIYVSNYLAQQEPISNKKIHVLYNAIDNDFLELAEQNLKQQPDYKNILMVSSLKSYKGVFEFVALAGLNLQFEFKLVVNASQTEIDTFFKNVDISNNIKIYPTQHNTHPFFAWADVVLNLSRPDCWVETFGLTIIEAMAYQLPVIVPPVGGITELVIDHKNGYLVDCRDVKNLSIKLNELLSNRVLYDNMRNASRNRIKDFNETSFTIGSLDILYSNYKS